MSRILVVEDNTIYRKELCRVLALEGYDAVEAGTVAEARAEHEALAFDLIITDLILPGGDGTDLIAQVGDTPVVVITSYGSVRSAVEAMKLGAVDYLDRPENVDDLLRVVKRLTDARRERLRVNALVKDVNQVWPVAGMIGQCPAMLQVYETIAKVAPTGVTVLVFGESGTGKELVARAIHDQSRRRDAPFVAQNCAAIPEGLAESELFGSVRGAYHGAENRPGLFEDADGGTLFLDEIGELPLKVQSKLLRVLQDGKVRRLGALATKERTVDVRLVAATNRNLKERVKEGHFREDLYFRLNVMNVMLPPLRMRGGDIGLIAGWLLLKREEERPGKGPLVLTPEALAAMHAYDWPGNVRELRNAIERAAILCETGRVTPKHLGLEEELHPLTRESMATTRDAMRDASGASSASIDEYCRAFILKHQDHLSETKLARGLGMSRTTLYRLRKRLGL